MRKPSTLTTSSLALAGALLLMPAAPAASAEDAPRSNQFWWPDQLDLSPLRRNAAESNPLGADFDYAKAFQGLDRAIGGRQLDQFKQRHRRAPLPDRRR